MNSFHPLVLLQLWWTNIASFKKLGYFQKESFRVLTTATTYTKSMHNNANVSDALQLPSSGWTLARLKLVDVSDGGGWERKDSRMNYVK